MNKSILSIFLFFASVFCAADAVAQGCPSPSSAEASVTFRRKIRGAVGDDFTIDVAGHKVTFSQGNLQYQASTDTWQFAAHQYTYIGNTVGNTTTSNRATQTYWIDLFGWGAENKTKSELGNYYLNGQFTTSGDWFTAANDWGTAAAGNIGDNWRTLKISEWEYIVRYRETGNTVNGTDDARYTIANINTDGTSVRGLIIFPDYFDGSVSYTGVTWGSINGSGSTVTSCTTVGWGALEIAGCVFLPAAGSRGAQTKVWYAGSNGSYWSSTSGGSSQACYLNYSTSTASGNCANRDNGFSVRLVKDLQ